MYNFFIYKKLLTIHLLTFFENSLGIYFTTVKKGIYVLIFKITNFAVVGFRIHPGSPCTFLRLNYLCRNYLLNEITFYCHWRECYA